MRFRIVRIRLPRVVLQQKSMYLSLRLSTDIGVRRWTSHHNAG
jgi:hypothetical protein